MKTLYLIPIVVLGLVSCSNSQEEQLSEINQKLEVLLEENRSLRNQLDSLKSKDQESMQKNTPSSVQPKTTSESAYMVGIIKAEIMVVYNSDGNHEWETQTIYSSPIKMTTWSEDNIYRNLDLFEESARIQHGGLGFELLSRDYKKFKDYASASKFIRR